MLNFVKASDYVSCFSPLSFLLFIRSKKISKFSFVENETVFYLALGVNWFIFLTSKV